MATKISIINQALLYLGQPPLNSLETQNTGLQGIIGAYDSIVREALSGTDWVFAMTTETLLPDPIVDPPTQLYSQTYHIPADMLRAVKTYPLSYNYEIQGKHIFSNMSSPWKLTYIKQVDESFYPEFFISYLAAQLASLTAMMLTENASLVQMWQGTAAVRLRNAKFQNASQQPSRLIQSNPLWETHGFSQAF